MNPRCPHRNHILRGHFGVEKWFVWKLRNHTKAAPSVRYVLPVFALGAGFQQDFHFCARIPLVHIESDPPLVRLDPAFVAAIDENYGS